MKENLDINKNLIDAFQNIKQLSETQQKDILKSIDIKNAIKTKNKIHIINYVIFEYAKNSNEALSLLKKGKVFFLDINSKNKDIIEILEFLLKNSKNLEFTEKDIIYFQSKKNLSLISEDIYNVLQQIRKEIKNYGDSFIRDILFIVDMHFYKIAKGVKSIDISIETLSEICSYLIYLFSQINKEHEISQDTFSSKISFNEKKLNNLILLSFKIKNFQDMEKFIDNFNYTCIKEKNKLIIRSEDTLIEKSRIYGNFHSNMQRQALMLDIIKEYKNAAFFSGFIDKISEKSKEFFELKEYPIPRYTFKFPLNDKIKEFILKDEYFLEEIFELTEIKKEYMIPDIMDFKISRLLTLKDLMIIKRLFIIIGLLNSDFFFNILEKDKTKKQLIYNSWIKAFNYQDLKNTLILFIGNDKADEFISEFSWSLQSNNKLDLQYTPLINLDDYYFPLNIFINSNLFRNSLFRNNIRPHKVMNKDAISLAIMNVLKKNFEKVATGIKFKKNGYVGDFDVIAYVDNVIYIFECKNTITPTDLHELRTTYKDNLLHGFEQLTKCKKVLLSDNYIKDLNSNLKWKISNDFKIVTCLVLGTRMYNGYTDGEHHVRSIHELVNFFDTGKINIIDKDIDKDINLWKSDNIGAHDIYDFIQNRILHKFIFNSFSSKINKESFLKQSILFETFEFNMNEFCEELNKNFT
ncbi:hypothetical protein O8C79_07060 [Aliarcobacter butzleri]|uniref:hypothetical protein n=1 Tax=Aliarcobacter butzleri TaxID=28197 RepID=UPI00263CFCE4|nr:hypothetical protein [Aliarcobacter butzleri]MDN5105043.1 hypothetical protein [Aliarcobacter butzleri]